METELGFEHRHTQCPIFDQALGSKSDFVASPGEELRKKIGENPSGVN